MAPLYKKALIVGATSGIGEALALALAGMGTHVIATGRRQDRLEALAAAAATTAATATGSGGITTIVQDVTDLAAVPAFAARMAAEHADLDCVVLNSGIQRAFDFGRPETVSLAAVGRELTTNYLAHVHLTAALLPQLQALGSVEGGDTRAEKTLLFVGATLGLVPSLVRAPNYNASKAALHAFVTALRQQQQDAGFAHLRVVEVFPPAVQTELHDAVHQPDLVDGGRLGMPLAAFTAALLAQLQTPGGPPIHIGIGPAEALLAPGGLEHQRQALFEQQQAALKQALTPFLRGPT